MLYIIKWRLTSQEPDTPDYGSPNLFSRSEATHLTNVANEHFKRAHHWMEPAQRPTGKVF